MPDWLIDNTLGKCSEKLIWPSECEKIISETVYYSTVQYRFNSDSIAEHEKVFGEKYNMIRPPLSANVFHVYQILAS